MTAGYCSTSARCMGSRLMKASSMSFSRKPGSNVVKFLKLRIKSSAPTSKTTEIAICETTSIRWKEKCSRPVVTPRLPDLSASAGLARDDRNAGTRLNTRQVVTAIEAVKRRTRQSKARLSSNTFRSVLSSHRMFLPKIVAKYKRRNLQHAAKVHHPYIHSG